MKVDHMGEIHAIDMVRAEDGDDVRLGLLDQVDVLIDGVRRSLIPGFTGRAHLGGDGNDELIFQQTAHLPAFVEMLQKALAAKLRQNVNGMDSRVDEIAEYEIDDSIFAPERNGWLGAFLG